MTKLDKVVEDVLHIMNTKLDGDGYVAERLGDVFCIRVEKTHDSICYFRECGDIVLFYPAMGGTPVDYEYITHKLVATHILEYNAFFGGFDVL